MKRAARYGLIALLAASLLVAGGWGGAWLAGTTEGARWLMESVSRHTPLKVFARKIEGRLADRLHLEGVHVVLAPFEAQIETLDFNWRPLLLLSGRVAVRELALAGVRVLDNTPPETPPDLSWPRVSAMAGLFDATIERLRVEGVTYGRPGGQPTGVTGISSSVAWRNALLSLSDLVVAAPSVRLAGSVEAGFVRPSLRFEFTATPALPLAGMDAFSLQARLLPGQGPEQLAGGFTVAGSSGAKRHLELVGEAGITRQAFNLRQLRLALPGRRGSVTGAGMVTLTAGAPLLALQIKVASLDLAPELNRPTDLSGTLAFSGTPERYGGEFALANAGKGWQTVNLSGAYQGNRTGVKLAPLRGSLLAGALEGSLDLRWGDGIFLKGTVRGRNLNPARIAPDWTGVVNFALTGNVAWAGHAPPQGEVSARLLDSRLHGQALTGELKADLVRGDLRIGRLTLQGKGFDIHAAGDPGKRLTFAVQVGDLGRLIPQTAGELRAEGWVSWHDGRLDGSVAGRGKNLAADGLRIAAANLTARLGEGKGYPLHIAATLRKAAYQRLLADSVTLEADGTALRHTVNAALSSAGAEARIALSGAYDRGIWRGEIVRFSGRDSIGAWSLGAPAPLSVAAGRITLAPLVVMGVPPERIEIAGELTGEPPGGSVRAVWGGLNLARMNPWLNEVRFTGTSAGNIRLSLPAAGRPFFTGSASALGTVKAEGYGIAVERGSVSLEGSEQGMRAGTELHLAGGGMLKGAFSSPVPVRLDIPERGEMTAEWTGIDVALIRSRLPRDISIAGRLAGRIAGKLLPGERLDLTGRIALARGTIRWQKESDALDATLHKAELSWGWQGALGASAAEIRAGRLVVAGRADASGVLTVDGHRISVEQGSVSLDGNERGLHAVLDLSLSGGGGLKGRLSSPTPAGLAIPVEGAVVLEWAGIDLLLLRPWLPRAVDLEGRLAGSATGNLLPGQRLALKGDSVLSGGKVRWLRPEGEINFNLRSASVSWDWQGEALRGVVALALAEHGEVRGSFQLPIPARLPVAPDRKGPLQASLTGQVREKGVLTSLFPGLIQESHGDLDADLRVGGRWEEPTIEGSLRLAGAGAYLPTAGIHVKDVQLAMRLEKDLVRIDSFRAASGPGHVEGTAFVRLKGWQVTGFQGSISGERFQAVYLPELQIMSSPRLTFEGTPEKLAIRGEVRLPELLIFGPPARTFVVASRDVILEGAPKPAEKTFPLALDVQVRLTLGERALVKTEGIDAQLGGSIDLTLQTLDRITSKGEIRVVKGRYKAYGADLEIVRGRLFYAGGPINQPTLDILALRTVGDVRAGVTAGGILRAPVIKLYSEPAMPDVDILAYILFGHPLGAGSSVDQAGMMAQLAGAFLSRGQSAVLQEQIKNRLGLSTLEIQSGGGEAPGRMGYKEIPSTPAGVAPAKPAGGVSQAMLTVGKYLTPQLYFSYGRSLFTGGNLFRLRYDLFKQWQIETQTGSASGADLYYKIDFN